MVCAKAMEKAPDTPSNAAAAKNLDMNLDVNLDFMLSTLTKPTRVCVTGV